MAHMPAAKKTGNVTIRPDSVVERLDTDPQTGRVTDVHVVDTKTRERLRSQANQLGEPTVLRLIDLLAIAVADLAGALDPSFFEITTAATFLAFARHPADACVIEVGLGGRFDATNVLQRPACCGIATLGIDHEAFLLVPEEGAPEEPMVRIAFEKAGIARPGSRPSQDRTSSGPLSSPRRS